MRRASFVDERIAPGAKLLLALAALVLLGSGCESGLRGQALVRQLDGGIGAPIAGVQLTFIREDGTLVRRSRASEPST
jgi:hypothetical protein